MKSLDVKKRRAKPVVSKILTLSGVHGHVAAALLAEMQDIRASACFENCETGFRYLRWMRQGACGGSGAMETCGQIRVVESRGKVEGQRTRAAGA